MSFLRNDKIRNEILLKCNLNLFCNIDEILIILKLLGQIWMIFGQTLDWAQMKFWWIFVVLLPLWSVGTDYSSN